MLSATKKAKDPQAKTATGCLVALLNNAGKGPAEIKSKRNDTSATKRPQDYCGTPRAPPGNDLRQHGKKRLPRSSIDGATDASIMRMASAAYKNRNGVQMNK